jgi:hypothetical protein
MIRRLHTRTKIFFPNPYVLRIDHHPEHVNSWEYVRFSELIRKTYKIMTGTWGYCHPEYESTFSDMSVLSSTFQPNGATSYWCFQDEVDALQFKLTFDQKSTRVYMWPSRDFTIHEIIHDES